jgi:hypothetical protein
LPADCGKQPSVRTNAGAARSAELECPRRFLHGLNRNAAKAFLSWRAQLARAGVRAHAPDASCSATSSIITAEDPSLIPKPANEISFDDLVGLTTRRAAETESLKFFRTLPRIADEDRKVLSRVVSFAGAEGGDIVFGILPIGRTASRLAGIDAGGLNAAVLRLEALLELWIQPRVRYELHRIPSADGPYAVVLRVRPDAGLSHRCTLPTGTPKHIDVDQQIGDFVRHRIVEIAGGRTPIPMLPPLDGASIVLHLVPRAAFGSHPLVPLSRLHRSPGRLQPMCNLHPGAENWQSSETPDGLLTYINGSYKAPRAYALMWSSGIVEGVNVRFYSFQKYGHWIISMHSTEEFLIMSTRRYLRFQKDLGIEMPIYIFLSLVGVQGAFVPTRKIVDSGWKDIVSFQQPVIFLEGGAFTDYSESVDARLRGPLDRLYQMCGAAGAEHFDDK